MEIFLRTCKSTGILQNHRSCVKILSQGFLPLLQLAPFEGIPCGGPRELGISGIDWGHKAWWYWILFISRGNVAHRCEDGQSSRRRNQGDSDELEPRVSTSDACSNCQVHFTGRFIRVQNIFKYQISYCSIFQIKNQLPPPPRRWRTRTRPRPRQ